MPIIKKIYCIRLVNNANARVQRKEITCRYVISEKSSQLFSS